MKTVARADSVLLVIDFQARLMPFIADGAQAVRETRRLIDAAGLLDVPVLVTEQNPAGLGGTVPELLPEGAAPFHKMTFDACRMPGFAAALGGRGTAVVTGCETHVCVMQTVLGLLDAGQRVFLVRDAVGSRTVANRDAAIARMAAHGAEVVTAEMVVFEWLETAEHPRFRDAVRLVK